MRTSRRQTLTRAAAMAAAAALVASAHPGIAWSQAFPARQLTIVVPYAPGATDQVARKLAELAARDLGQPVVVENKEGAGGAIGSQSVAQSKPDGHTLLFAAPAVVTVLPLLGNAPYGYDDLMPVARATTAPHLLAARADAPYRSAAEMIAHARANPGKIVFGSSGLGTAVHLAGEAFADAAGIKLHHVPYRGLAPAITASLGGFVDIVIGLPSALKPHLDAGKMRALVQFGAARDPVVPDVPTLRELGVDVALAVDIGFFAPKGTPADVVAKIDQTFSKAVGSAEFKAFSAAQRVTPAFLDAADYRRVVDTERRLYARIVPALKLGEK